MRRSFLHGPRRHGALGALAVASCLAGLSAGAESVAARSLPGPDRFTSAHAASRAGTAASLRRRRNGHAQTRTLGNWDTAEQRLVVAEGLMRSSGGSFQGAAPLSAAAANSAFAVLAEKLHGSLPEAQISAVRAGNGNVTMVAFDALLARELGLGATAAHVQAAARGAGLEPPWYFGSEVVVRYLELRYEQPIGFEALDRFPTESITRAEAAWSLAESLKLSAWAVQGAASSLGAFALPHFSADQLAVLRIAVAKIGFPYVWGGTTDGTEDGLAHGGFDCSGFIWRVYKVSGLRWGEAIRGRTAAEQAGEIARSARRRGGQLQPGDLLFFGSARFNGAATEHSVIHEGLYLGSNWVIHSSGQGVFVEPLEGSWLGESFAWGRRVLPD